MDVKETDDYIEIDGHRMKKPIVEKPLTATTTTSTYITLNPRVGAEAVSKVKNNERFFPKRQPIRRDGSYCYEEFIVGAKDLKVYTIGPDYAHGETQSPARDGIVARNPDGKELRC